MKNQFIIGAFVVVCGSVSAQTSATLPKQTNESREVGKTEAFRLEETPAKLEQNQTKISEENKSGEKTVITKEMWENKSERGRQYILAHPELYIVEQ